MSIWSPVFDIMDFFRPATDAITARRKGDYKESVGWDKRACSERPWDQGKVWRSVASTTEFQSMAVALLFVSVLHRHQYLFTTLLFWEYHPPALPIGSLCIGF